MTRGPASIERHLAFLGNPRPAPRLETVYVVTMTRYPGPDEIFQPRTTVRGSYPTRERAEARVDFLRKVLPDEQRYALNIEPRMNR